MTVEDRFRRSVPWRLPDLYLLVALVATGIVLVAVARVGAGGRDRLADQVAWANLGVGGLIVVCLGCVLWVLAGVRATAELRRVVLRQVRAALEPVAAAAPAAAPRFVATPSMTRYHLPSCPLVAGKPAAAAPPDGLQPCGVCLEAPE